MSLIIKGATQSGPEKWLRNSAARSVIAKRLGVRNMDTNMPDSMLEWHPIWTYNRSTGGKRLIRIILRLKGALQLTEFANTDIDDDQVNLEDVMEYLKESYAKKLEPTQCLTF